jgi:hypothetical protein
MPPAEKVRFDINSALEHILNDLPKLERGAVNLTTSSPAIADVGRNTIGASWANFFTNLMLICARVVISPEFSGPISSPSSTV